MPSRRAKRLPISSIRIVRAASLHHLVKRSRARMSSVVSARRRTPPLGVAPIFAISVRVAHRRGPLVVVVVMLALRVFWLAPGLQLFFGQGSGLMPGCCCLGLRAFRLI